MTEPRGIRNNNPGNIVKGVNWQGMAEEQSDPTFIVFRAPEWGIRAMARILHTYRTKHGLTTVQGIINRWAPPSENETSAYVDFVANKLGVTPTTELTFCEDQLVSLLEAIIHYENGQQPYDRETILKGIELEEGSRTS